MFRVAIKILSLLWIGVITPIFGILPIIVMFSEPSGVFNMYGVAFFRDIGGLISKDPSPDVSHLTLFDIASRPSWFAIIICVFFIAVVAIKSCFFKRSATYK